GWRPQAGLVLALCVFSAWSVPLAAAKAPRYDTGGTRPGAASQMPAAPASSGGSGAAQTPAGRHQDDVRHGIGTSTAEPVGGEGIELAGFLLLGLAAIVPRVVIPSQLAKGIASRRKRQAAGRPRLV